MLDKIFKQIQTQKKNFASANDGERFEEKLIDLFKKTGFSRIFSQSESKKQRENFFENISDFIKWNSKLVESEWNKIKENVLAKNSIEQITNPWPELKNSYIYQPFGSQQFPDFLFFTEEYIIPIEVKFSKSEVEGKKLKKIKPMWNSNLPKANAFYIFGVSNSMVTFFSGADVLDSNTRIKLNQFFDDLGGTDEDIENTIKEMLSNLPNPFGFKPYIRKAFDQNVKASTLFDDDGKAYIESFFSEKASVREQNVINFLESLNKKDFISK